MKRYVVFNPILEVLRYKQVNTDHLSKLIIIENLDRYTNLKGTSKILYLARMFAYNVLCMCMYVCYYKFHMDMYLVIKNLVI